MDTKIQISILPASICNHYRNMYKNERKCPLPPTHPPHTMYLPLFVSATPRTKPLLTLQPTITLLLVLVEWIQGKRNAEHNAKTQCSRLCRKTCRTRYAHELKRPSNRCKPSGTPTRKKCSRFLEPLQSMLNSRSVYCMHQRNAILQALFQLLEKMQVVDHAAINVLIIILFFSSSATSRFRTFNTVSKVSTTLWKLLAAPCSWVNRAMLRWLRLPCSITVMISPAKVTSFMSRTAEISFFTSSGWGLGTYSL